MVGSRSGSFFIFIFLLKEEEELDFFFFFAGLLLVRELGTESILMLQAGVNQLSIPAESKHQSLVRYPQEELYTNLSETWHLTHAEWETPSASSKPTTCRSVWTNHLHLRLKHITFYSHSCRFELSLHLFFVSVFTLTLDDGRIDNSKW